MTEATDDHPSSLSIRFQVLELHFPSSTHEGNQFDVSIDVGRVHLETQLVELQSRRALFCQELIFGMSQNDYNVDRIFDLEASVVVTDCSVLLEEYHVQVPILYIAGQPNKMLPKTWFTLTGPDGEETHASLCLGGFIEAYPRELLLPQNRPLLEMFGAQLLEHRGLQMVEDTVSQADVGAMIHDLTVNPHTLTSVIDVLNNATPDILRAGPVLKTGCFRKRGGAIKTWKLRYFVLTPFALRYYKQQTDVLPIRTLPIAPASVTFEGTTDATPKPNIVRFHTIFAEREYLFSFSTEDEAMEWATTISAAINEAKTVAVSSPR